MNKNQIYYFSIFIFLPIAFLLIIFSISTIPNKARCKSERIGLNLELINGIIIGKYKDSTNHNYETIEYRIEDKKRRTTIFIGDFSGCFDYLKVGDRLIKEKNSLRITVSRENVDSIFVLNFKCE